MDEIDGSSSAVLGTAVTSSPSGKEVQNTPVLGAGAYPKTRYPATQAGSQLKNPYEGDGADPFKEEPLVLEQSILDCVAYSVSLNYNRLATSVLSPLTRWHWYDRIPHSSLILGAIPSPQLLAQLQRELHVEDIVNMCAEFSGHLETMQELGLVQCWVPTRDFCTPTLASIWIGVQFIEKCEKQWQGLGEDERGRIYVHCKAGRGRSATVALCWLVFSYKLTVQEAQRILLKSRSQVDRNIHLHPEVISFYKEVQEQEESNTITRRTWPEAL